MFAGKVHDVWCETRFTTNHVFKGIHEGLTYTCVTENAQGPMNVLNVRVNLSV